MNDVLESMLLLCGSHPRHAEVTIVRRVTGWTTSDLEPVECGLALVHHSHGEHALVFELVSREGMWQIDRVAQSEPPFGILQPLVHPGVGATFASVGPSFVATLEAVIGDVAYRDASSDGNLLLFVPAPKTRGDDAIVRIRALTADGNVVASGSYWLGTTPTPQVLGGLIVESADSRTPRGH